MERTGRLGSAIGALTAARARVDATADGRVIVGLSGDWLVGTPLPGCTEVAQALAGPNPRVLECDAAALGRWDSGLMVFLVACAALCRERRLEFRTGNLPPGAIGLLRLSEAVPERREDAHDKRPGGWLRRIGLGVVGVGCDVRSAVAFLGETVLALQRLVQRRAQFRWADTFLVMQQSGPEALGIVALINFLVGLILAFVGTLQLERFGATIYSADLVAIGTVREMGCLMTGIIMCGRTGAAFAAQLGTMRVNQEIEAFETFGISPYEFLVLPRVLALVLMMPLLCVFADFIAILGGFAVSTLMLDGSPALYVSRTIEAISLSSFLLGIVKGTFFGLLVALTGCQRGMQCGRDAAAVGQATTLAVVMGITAIIASDGVFAVICSALDL